MSVYEKLNFDYSKRNIPISNKTEHILKLLDKVKNFRKRVKIKLWFVLMKNTTLI